MQDTSGCRVAAACHCSLGWGVGILWMGWSRSNRPILQSANPLLDHSPGLWDGGDMTRREMLELMRKTAITGGLAALPAASAAAEPQRKDVAMAPPPSQLPGTDPLTREGDLAAQMVEGIHRYLTNKTTKSVEKRGALWNRDYSSRAAYESSVAPQPERFRQIIGVIDPRIPFSVPCLEIPLGVPSVVASGDGYKVSSVRWPVLEGVDAEGLLLEPAGIPLARIVALPEADWSPEMLVGLAPGVPSEAQFARRLAEHGCLVLIPPSLIARAHGPATNNSASSRTSRIESTSIAWRTRLAVTSSDMKFKKC